MQGIQAPCFIIYAIPITYLDWRTKTNLFLAVVDLVIDMKLIV